MRVVHSIAGVRADHGGPSRSVPALCDALAATGAEVHLIAGVPADRNIKNNLPTANTKTHLVQESRLHRQWQIDRGFRRELRQLSDSPGATIIHDHGMWLPSNHAIAKEAKRLGVPRVVSPRGMLSAWSMNRRRLLKRCLWKLYQGRDLKSADAFVATSELEAEDIRRLGFAQPIAVIPNGITVPDAMPKRKDPTKRQILCLSRIHPVKGIVELVVAFCNAKLPEPWRLVIAGPDEAGHQSAVERKVQELGIAHRVEFLGSVDDVQKWQLYADADLFVLPSFTENFGIVIAEAMAAGLPVVTTTGTPWECLQKKGMGWWIPPECNALARTLAEATKTSPENLRSMGQNASRYARDNFAWPAIAKKMLTFYTELKT